MSTYLDHDDLRFDLVIFDEASQVRPFDAISAIYRGRQLVVAGDEKQLPPTDFFARAGGDDPSSEDEEAITPGGRGRRDGPGPSGGRACDGGPLR